MKNLVVPFYGMTTLSCQLEPPLLFDPLWNVAPHPPPCSLELRRRNWRESCQLLILRRSEPKDFQVPSNFYRVLLYSYTRCVNICICLHVQCCMCVCVCVCVCVHVCTFNILICPHCYTGANTYNTGKPKQPICPTLFSHLGALPSSFTN